MAAYEEVQGGAPIGRGGFAEVRFCARTDDGEPFAKKVLVEQDDDSRLRFHREVNILRYIAGRKIMPIIDADLSASPPFYIMPMYNQCLRAVIPEISQDHRRIPQIFGQILDAVERAHSLGVIHRDLNPNNILMNDDSDVVVSDFGLGRRLDSVSTRATSRNATMGTSGYMAPEQYRSADGADERSDIFSLGVILNEMYTGTTALGTPLPAPVLVIVRRCTSQGREARFQTAVELKRAFESIMSVEDRRASTEALRRLRDGQLTPDVAEALAAAVPRAAGEDGLLLHDIVVRIPASTFERLTAVSPEVAALLIENFREVSKTARWTFDYTDNIGNACTRLYPVTSDAHLKASLLATALHVGVNHNRYHVMDAAATMLQAPINESEAMTILAELEPIRHYLVGISDRLQRDRIHPTVRALVEVAEQEYRVSQAQV